MYTNSFDNLMDARRQFGDILQYKATQADRRTIEANGVNYLSFSNFNSLDVIRHLDWRKALFQVIEHYGFHVGSARAFVDCFEAVDLERKLGESYGTSRALALPSVSVGHIAMMQYFSKAGMEIIYPSEVHISIRTAFKSAGFHPRRLHRFAGAHLCEKVDEVEGVIQAAKNPKKLVLLSESTHSVLGSREDLKWLAVVQKRYGTGPIYLDDSNDTGFFSADSGGKHEPQLLGQLRDSDFIVAGTFAKALGLYGGYIVATDAALLPQVRVGSSAIAFTGPLPTWQYALNSLAWSALVEGRLADDYRQINSLRERLISRVGATQSRSNICFFPCNALKSCSILKSLGIIVSPLVYPVVPRDSEGLRIVITSAHKEEDVDRLISAISSAH